MSNLVRWHCTFAILVLVFSTGGMSGCGGRSRDVPDQVRSNKEFSVFWPPRDLGRTPGESDKPLLQGELSVFEIETDQTGALRMHITLHRPHEESDRIRWNQDLAFPESSWMAKVRVWDRDHQWLWPNLPYLLRAHGVERVQRYGGVDPGKGVDNDFAAVLIRSLEDESSRTAQQAPALSAQPQTSHPQIPQPLVFWRELRLWSQWYLQSSFLFGSISCPHIRSD